MRAPQIGGVRPDPLEAAYRTIDRLSATLDRAQRAIHANHSGVPTHCPETICIEIRRATYRP